MGYLAGLTAIELESAAADGLLMLPADGRRFHVHYTHVRTKGASDVQPDQLSRAKFSHMVSFQQCRCHICASQRKLAILDPFKPCPGTVDG